MLSKLEAEQEENRRLRNEIEKEKRERETEKTQFVVHAFQHRPVPSREDLENLTGGELLADSHSNTVVVRVERPEEIARVSAVLSALDIPSERELYGIQAVIVNAVLSSGDDFSVDWLAEFAYPINRTNTGLAALSPGGLDLSTDWFTIAIEKAKTQERLAILARPALILSPGESATISSGREVPLPVSNVQDGNLQTTVEFRSVALLLEVSLEEIGNGIGLRVSQVNEEITGETLIAGTSVPELASQRWESSLRPVFGRWYALGGVVTGSKSDTQRKGWILRNLRSRGQEANQVGMFIRVVPVESENPPQFVEDVKAGGETVFPVSPPLIATPIPRAVPVGK